MTKPILKTQLLEQLIRLSNGQIFSVNFTKADGTIRDMRCRLGVKKHLKGGTKPFVDVDHGLITVFDMDKKQYRSIKLERVNELKINGEVFRR